MFTLLSGLAMVALFAGCDRFAGGDYMSALQAWKPSWAIFKVRSTYVAGVFLTAVLAAVHLPLALIGVAWLIWRIPAWKYFDARLDPDNGWEIFGLFLRHFLFMVPSLLLFNLVLHLTWLPLVIGTALWALMGALGGWVIYLTAKANNFNFNPINEALRGAIFGAVIAYLTHRF